MRRYSRITLIPRCVRRYSSPTATHHALPTFQKNSCIPVPNVLYCVQFNIVLLCDAEWGANPREKVTVSNLDQVSNSLSQANADGNGFENVENYKSDTLKAARLPAVSRVAATKASSLLSVYPSAKTFFDVFNWIMNLLSSPSFPEGTFFAVCTPVIAPAGGATTPKFAASKFPS